MQLVNNALIGQLYVVDGVIIFIAVIVDVAGFVNHVIPHHPPELPLKNVTMKATSICHETEYETETAVVAPVTVLYTFVTE